MARPTWINPVTSPPENGFSIPDVDSYVIDGRHIRAQGWAALINSTKGKSLDLTIRNSILEFASPDASGAPGPGRVDLVTGAPVKMPNKSALWIANLYGVQNALIENVDAGFVLQEHVFYPHPNGGGKILFRNCYIHDAGSQACQFRPEGNVSALGNAANVPGLIRFEDCLIENCGHPLGRRPSHALKVFYFEEAFDPATQGGGKHVQSQLSLELEHTWIRNYGCPPHLAWGSNGKYRSFGGIFSHAKNITMIRGGIQYVQPNYELVHHDGWLDPTQKVLFDGVTMDGGKCWFGRCAGSLIVRNGKGNGSIVIDSQQVGSWKAGYSQ
jgi:hypothetical protein